MKIVIQSVYEILKLGFLRFQPHILLLHTIEINF